MKTVSTIRLVVAFAIAALSTDNYAQSFPNGVFRSKSTW